MRLRQDPKSVGTNDVFGKVWLADGSTPEPADWQMVWGYTTAHPPLSTGFPGITGCSSDGLGQLEVDYVLIKSAGLPSITVNFAPQGPAVNPPVFNSITHNGNKVVVDWFGGNLQSATTFGLTNTWTDVTPATAPASPSTNTTAAGTFKFYRVRQ